MLPQVDTQSRPVGHLPFIRWLMAHLGIFEVIDEHCPMHDQARVSDAECVAAMVLNILSGRVALYAMETWLAHTDTELLLGEGCTPDAFNDTRLALALDHLDAIGTDTILGGIVERYLATPDRPTAYSVHTDTSSFLLYGAYEEGLDPFVTFGFSKDKRPDLKQLLFGLSLHGAVGMPLVADIVAGNTSDTEVNRDFLVRLSRLLPPTDEVTVVADCKAVDAGTVGRVLDEGLHLISLVPDTFAARGKLIEAAWQACPDLGEWPELERSAGRLKADPDKVYRGWSTIEPFTVERKVVPPPGTVPEVEGKEEERYKTQVPMRFVVVHSTTLAQKFERSLQDKLEAEQAQLDEFVRRVGSKGFGCETDARKAASKVTEKLKLLAVEIHVEAEQVTLKRPRRGRPRKDEETPTQTVYTVRFEAQPDEDAIERARQRKSCFVLISDHTDSTAWPDQRILHEYRQQHLVENHTGFRWLKSEAAVSPMFIKTTSRIRAMGLVMVLSLMVRNFIQFTMRAALVRSKQKLQHPFTKKEVPTLTTEMAMAWFMGVRSTQISIDGGPFQRVAPKLPPTALRILELVGAPLSCFSQPPSRAGPAWAGK